MCDTEIQMKKHPNDMERQIDDVKIWIKTFERDFVSDALNDFDEALERGEAEDRKDEIVSEWYRMYSTIRI
jgi:hypothetical protein